MDRCQPFQIGLYKKKDDLITPHAGYFRPGGLFESIRLSRHRFQLPATFSCEGVP